MVQDVVIVSAARSPIGTFLGSLSTLKSHDLGSAVVTEVLKRGKTDPADVSEVVFGQALTTGEGQNPSRQSAIKAGIPYTVPAYLVNLLCGSGLKAVVAGCQSIQLGETSIAVCGGQESMSQAPHYLHIRTGVKYGESRLVDTVLSDGLTDAFNNIHMGVTAENLAAKYSISREEQDMFAMNSNKKAAAAQQEGIFKAEIVPITVKGHKRNSLVTEDEHIQHGTSMESLAKLKPVFLKDGTVTAGNASGLNDGAAAVLLMSAEVAKQRGLTPLARVVAYAHAGVDPNIMGYGVVPAVNLLLKKTGWAKEDVDLYELSEAFAAQALTVIKELAVDPAKVNIYGGAVALGHPIGGSGARILVTLLYALKRTGGKRGVAALCVGGGQGIAIAVQTD